MDQKSTGTVLSLKFLLFALMSACWLSPAHAQVDIVATGGTPTATYTNLSTAFTAINNGTHTGDITVNISNSFTDVAPAILNSSGAGTASYTSVLVQPVNDGITVSFATAGGRGVIELNGADNVTINGDNPNTAGTNRNLTINNTAAAATTFTSVIRVAAGTAAPYLDNSNIAIRNLILNGSATGSNNSGATTTTNAANNTFGIVAGPNGGATVTALASVTTAMNASANANAFTIDNCAINQCGRGISFLGANTSASTGVTITNNQVGNQSTTVTGAAPFTTPATSVYVKGIIVQGTNAVNISGNTLRNIFSYINTPMSGIELTSNIGTGQISIASNTIHSMAQNSTSTSTIRCIVVSNSGGAYSISNNNITNIQGVQSGLGAATTVVGIEVNTTAPSGTIELNRITRVHSQNAGTTGAYGMHLAGGNNITVRNNFISDINQNITGGAATFSEYCAVGIRINAGTGHRLYYNNIHLSGTYIGASSNLLFSSALAIVSTTSTGMDISNNIFSNLFPAGGTNSASVCLHLPSSATSAMNLTLNNNAYYTGSVAGASGIAMVGTAYVATPTGPTTYAGLYTVTDFNAAATTPVANLRAYTSTLSAAGTNDNASVASVVAPPFISASDLHINIAAPNASDVDAKGAVIGSITTDIDGDTRNATTPDIGADEFTIPICAGAVGGTAAPATTTICSGQSVDLSVTGATIGIGTSYQWEVSSTGGGVGFANVTGGTGATTLSYNTGTLTAGTYYYRLNVTCATGPVTNYSNEVVVTVNALPTIGITPATASKCATDPAVTLTASGAVSYTWSPANGLSATTGATVSANPVATTLYTITGTDASGCVGTGSVSLTVYQVPSAPIVTPTSPSICSGGSIVLNASATYLTPASNVLGSGVSVTLLSTTASTNFPNPLAHYYGGNKHQMLIRASELTALGLVPGSVISSLGFPVASVNSTEALQSYLVRMGHTSLTTIATLQTGLSDVRAAAPYNPVTSPGVSTITFDTPFTWNGTDNLIIETSFSNNDAPSAGNVTMTYGTTAYQSCIVYRADNTLGATMNGYTGAVTFTMSARPNITFGYANPTAVPGSSISWSPGTGLSATTGGSVTASPASTTTYTLTATNGSCTSAPGTVTLSVGAPLVCTPITAPSGMVCAGTSFALTANLTGGGPPYSFAWSDGVGGVYPNAATINPVMTAGTYTFTVTVTDGCGSNCSSNVMVTVNPGGGSITGPTSGLTHQNMSYAASGYAAGSSFQWQSAATSGGPYTNVTGATANTLGVSTGIPGTYYYVCVITAPSGCVNTSNEIATVITLAGNDVCGAIPLSSGLNGPFSNQGATIQTGEVVPPLGSCTGQGSWCAASGGISHTVWFSFVAPASGKASIHFVPGSWDSEIAVWSAASCGDLLTGGGTLVAANDDSSGSSPYNAFIDVTCLTPGTTYYVQVDGYSTTTNSNFSLFLKTHNNTAPAFVGMPANISISNDAGTCGAAVTWTAPTLNDADNCVPAMMGITSSHNSGDVFPVGTTTVTYTGTDGVNTINSSFDVTVNDTAFPVISSCPSNITIAQNNVGCTAIVNWTAPSTSDNCTMPSMVSSHSSGDVFPLGVTTVTYTSTDASNNITTCSFDITVTSDLDATLTTSTDASCNGNTDGSIDASVSGTATPYVYDWDNDGTGDTDDPEDLSTLGAGTYMLVVTDANNCKDTVMVTIAEPAAITTNQTFTICDGESVTVGSSTYSTTGIYTDVLSAINGCDSTVTTNLTVNAPVNTGTSSSSLTITASSTLGAYQWINCATMMPISGETNQSYTATANGNYAVIVTETGCTDTSSCVLITGVGINEISNPGFILYPNPTTGAFTIESGMEGNFNLLNRLGETVMTGKLNKGQNHLHAGDLARGVYLVRIHDLDGRLLNTQRLTITK